MATENIQVATATTLVNNAGDILVPRTKTSIVTNADNKNVDTLLSEVEMKSAIYAQEKADEAKSEAIVAAGTDSTAKANAAESRAKAASDPKGSAATAKTEAIQAASTDSTAKANAVDTKLTAHDGNATKHITAAERTNWNAKETVAGAQAKADAAKNASDTKGSAAAVRTELLPMVNLKAPIASPSFTGAPTAPTAALGSTNTAQLATLGFVNNAVAAFVNGAPGALDTLNELAAALGDDPNFATTITNLIATKAARAVPATLGNLAKLDGNGNVVDSGKSAASFEASGSVTAHNSASNPHAGVLTQKYFFTVTLPVSGWSATAPYTQTVSVAGMRVEYDPMYDVEYSSYTDDYKRQREEMQFISLLTTANGSITARCDSDKPSGNITIKMKEVF